ncbi:hypothetical protein PFTANZ_01302 [Plasmodium falciparum Tanzania (2000708)]|uniref:Uncharacterized protein n=1 Tax=Plasmodium falciparum Tanzania (2000708) TaxID=1036725 RepID=A0A024WAS5_PLAFA|nr:hypothetical protein PFTANZ_01302 [Plasmodium falciparum Tanzania (2000708)]
MAHYFSNLFTCYIFNFWIICDSGKNLIKYYFIICIIVINITINTNIIRNINSSITISFISDSINNKI